MRWSKYTEYRTTQLAWVARAPNHWQFKRLKYLATLNPTKDEIADLPRDTEISFLPMEAIGDDGSIDLDRTRLLDSIQTGYTYMRDGDIVTAKITPCFENGKGAVIDRLMNGIGFGSTELTVVRPSGDIDRSYIYWLLHSKPVRDAGTAEMYGAGGQKRVPEAFWSNLAVPVPELAEQQKIAQFLCQATAKTEKLIRKQEYLIESLEQRRRAVISTFITQGLNCSSASKDSGNPWIGKIPSHWTVTRLKHVAEVRSGATKGRDLSGQATITVPYMRVANVQDGYLDLDDVASIEIAADELDRFLLEPGDVLMNEGGDNDKLGRGHIWRGEISPCIHQNHVFAVRPFAVEPEWLNWANSADYARSFFLSRAKQSTNLASISSTNLRELPIPYPPEAERREIVAYLDKETNRISALIAKARHVIDLMREHRSALIAAAVTGKIDVREANA